jgi:hypothetical protein
MKNNKIILAYWAIFFLINFSFASNYKFVEKEIKEENKSKKYEISVVYPQMDGFRDKSVQDDFNKYVFGLVNESVEGFKKEMKGWVSMGDYPSEFDIVDTIFMQNDNLISIRFDGYQMFSGAAHPTTFFISVNYNLKDNEPVKLSDIFMGKYLNTISGICIKDLIRQKNEYAPDDPDVSWINEGAGPKEENYEVFNIQDNSLLITFPVYLVASYAEGPKEVNIPYTNIKNIIDKNGVLSYVIK